MQEAELRQIHQSLSAVAGQQDLFNKTRMSPCKRSPTRFFPTLFAHPLIFTDVLLLEEAVKTAELAVFQHNLALAAQ
jgi:hypothetical protein